MLPEMFPDQMALGNLEPSGRSFFSIQFHASGSRMGDDVNAAVTVYRCSGERGFSPRVSAESGVRGARKLERDVQVQFASDNCTVQTPEGIVYARPGDAILTGTAGEHWRVSRAHFGDKYRPVPPTISGDAGIYRSLAYKIRAVSMNRPFQVILMDGVSHLSGKPGDWLVDYGDGSLGIVAAPIFANTYQLVD